MTPATPRRSASDRKVAGVCAGMAQHWGVDPLVVRLGCALLALSGGVGVVLYLAAWLLMPHEGRSEPMLLDLLSDQVRSWPRELRIVLVVVGSVVVLAVVNQITPFGFGPAAVLAMIWYFGYYKNRDRRTAGGQPPGHGVDPQGLPVGSAPDLRHSPVLGPPVASASGPTGAGTPFTEAVAAWQQRVAQAQAMAAAPPVYPPYPNDPPYPNPGYPAYPYSHPYSQGAFDPSADPVATEPELLTTSRRGRKGRAVAPSARRLRLVAVVALIVTLSALGVADRSGRAVPVAGYLAAALLVLGLTLVAAAWFGRARGLLPVAVLVMLATLVTTVTGPVASAYGWDAQQVSYRSASQLVSGDQRRLGMLDVNLGQLAVTTDTRYAAHVDTGALRVTVPADADVVVNWRVGSGAAVINGEEAQAGPDLSGVKRFDSRNGTKAKTIVLDLSVDQGGLEVRR